MMIKTFYLVISLVLQVAIAAPSEDEIIDLPGLPSPPNFQQYSGYLNATGDKLFHYWFVESQNDSRNDPLVLWLNGGPGCSSVDGLLTENGPFEVNDDGVTLRYNAYSWNTIANVIYLESPTGVGFSYSPSGDIKTNDVEVAEDNYAALLSFFDKFPEFKSNDFYIVGESYGGIYVPSLSVNIVNGDTDINFKAFGVGNGMHNWNLNDDSLIPYLAYHGVFSSKLMHRVLNTCCHSTTPITCDFLNGNPACKIAVADAELAYAFSGLNHYNIYSDCVTPFKQQLATRFHPWISVMKKLGLQVSNNDPPCQYSKKEANYLNQPEVRNALHIPKNVQRWTQCSELVSASYTDVYSDMSPQYKILLPKVRALIYHGDADSMCNFLGGEWFVDALEQEPLDGYRPWHYDQQTAGFVKDFVNITYATVLGSGHMVPTDKPAQALHLFKAFLNDEILY